MQIQLVSDVHLERHRDEGAGWLQQLPQLADVLVLAGDFIPLLLDYQKVRDRALKTLCERYQHIIYVFGNHEFYGSGKAAVQKFRDSKAVSKLSNLHILQEETVTFDGVTFAGSTLWFPNDPFNMLFEKQWSDFKSIDSLRDWVYDANRQAVAFFGNTDAQVWITHHAPTFASRDPRYQSSSDFSRFTFTDLTALILHKQPQLCLHGHIHWAYDYQIDQTRVLCNPHGYPHDTHLDANQLGAITVQPCLSAAAVERHSLPS